MLQIILITVAFTNSFVFQKGEHYFMAYQQNEIQDMRFDPGPGIQ